MQKSNLPYLIIPLLIVCFCLFFNSCRTDRCDKPDCETINKIDPEFARFWDFGYGSYWVYNLKSDTTVLDTQNLFSDFNKTNGNCPPFNHSGPPCSEFIRKDLQHSNYSIFPRLNSTFTAGFTFFNSFIYPNVLTGSTGSGKYQGLNILNFSFTPHSNTEMQLTDTNSIVVNKITYYNVAHLQTTLDTSIRKFIYTNQWWSKDIGLIKFNTSDGNEWELKSYELKK